MANLPRWFLVSVLVILALIGVVVANIDHHMDELFRVSIPSSLGGAVLPEPAWMISRQWMLP